MQNDGDDVKLKTKIVTATITGTLIDDPLAVFKIYEVLLPKELFKAAPKPAPKLKSKSKGAAAGGDDDDEEADGPGPDSDDLAAADEDDSNDGERVRGGGVATLCFSLALGFLAYIC